VSRDGDRNGSCWRMDGHQQLVGPVCQWDVPQRLVVWQWHSTFGAGLTGKALPAGATNGCPFPCQSGRRPIVDGVCAVVWLGSLSCVS
jgi:hypothetical protein